MNISASNPSSWPGEGGRAVVIPSNMRDEAKKRFKENQFNIVASDLIALNRSINDQRSSQFEAFLCLFVNLFFLNLTGVDLMNFPKICQRHRLLLFFITKEIRRFYEH